MTDALDLEAINEKWLRQCPSCDAGLLNGCTCPQDDYRPVILSLVREVERLRAESEPAACVMTHTPPMDFAQCETHDTTFSLGEECRFKDRDVVEVLAEETDEQRQRAVRAEMDYERLREATSVEQRAEMTALTARLLAEVKRTRPVVAAAESSVDVLKSEGAGSGNPWFRDHALALVAAVDAYRGGAGGDT